MSESKPYRPPGTGADYSAAIAKPDFLPGYATGGFAEAIRRPLVGERGPEAIQISKTFSYNLADVDLEPSPILAAIQAKVSELMIARMKAWERATLEAAFDCGLDLRQPWGTELAVFAQMSWNYTFGARRPDSYDDLAPRYVDRRFGFSRYGKITGIGCG